MPNSEHLLTQGEYWTWSLCNTEPGAESMHYGEFTMKNSWPRGGRQGGWDGLNGDTLAVVPVDTPRGAGHSWFLLMAVPTNPQVIPAWAGTCMWAWTVSVCSAPQCPAPPWVVRGCLPLSVVAATEKEFILSASYGLGAGESLPARLRHLSGYAQVNLCCCCSSF